jgi:hypothetical protein
VALEVPFRRVFRSREDSRDAIEFVEAESSEVKEKCGDAAPEGFEECPRGRVGPR